MKEQMEILYQEMVRAISEYQKAKRADMVESCFWTTCRYWDRLKKMADKKFFEKEGNEIDFFRNIKPKFTSHIQYYTLLAEVLLFIPAGSIMQIEFWREELKRYWRYCQRHKDFVNYYESQSVYLDSVYFVRVSPDWVAWHQPASYDTDKSFCSSHDHLVRGLLAHKMYNDYVKEQLDLVKNEI